MVIENSAMLCFAMNDNIDPQNEMHSLARVTTEELPGYAEWCAEVAASQEGGEDAWLDAFYESRTEG